MHSKKWMFLLALLTVAGLLLAACQPETVVETVVVTVEGETIVVTATPAPDAGGEEVAGGECCDVYRVGIYEDPVSLNYWNYLGPGSSVWTSYVLSGYAASMYTLSDQRFDFVPSLATDLPGDFVQEGDFWTVEVPMVQDAQWSDGEPVTAHDVVFTLQACKDLRLTQNWPNYCPDALESVEAVDDYTVKYTFNEQPGLGTWQAGVALSAILPEHFWADTVANARTFIEGVEDPAPPEGVEDCMAEELSAEDATACEPYLAALEAYENARMTLYEGDATGSPTFGGYVTDQMELGAFVQRTQNPNYYFEGAEIVEYDDGTWMLIHPNGTTYQLYGDATGEETLRYTSGPYAPNIIFSVYGSQDGAFLALVDGEIDFVFSPTGIPRGLQEQAQNASGINTYTNADYGMYYIAFNLRKEPMSYYEFREAFDILIDKEFVINNVLQGTVFPMYSVMPPGNGFWHNADVPTPYVGMTREERINAAVEVLSAAGWTWEQEPVWDADLQDVVPGVGLTMPNGEPCPELTILGPGPAYDPLRATFNQWISEWGRELGVPVESELTGFNTILGPVFIEANFDMYILGWSLGNVAFPTYFESFWHSRNDTAITGSNNTPGLNDPVYDAMCDEFMNTNDLERARELVFEMQVYLADMRPYIPLYYKQVHDVARDNIIFPYTEVLSGITDAAGFQTDAQPLFR
ncbi:MAG: ABC transporter substrate-binding protein [Anaerolineae bacterium]|nr:ABC transporter substrate-binding protein [Anaerolineae bacterium]